MKPSFMKKYPLKIPNIVKITDKEEAMIEHKPKVCHYWHGNKRQLARDESGFYNGLQFLTTDKFMLFLKNIPLKVTLATRSDFPRRFEQVFRSKNSDIFAKCLNSTTWRRNCCKRTENQSQGARKQLVRAEERIDLRNLNNSSFPEKDPQRLIK